MGQSGSSSSSKPQGSGATASSYNKPAASAPVAHFDTPPLQIEMPAIYRTNGEQTQPKVLNKQLACALVDALPPTCLSGGMYTKQKWVLLYDSVDQGKSFQTLIQSITKKGPVIIVIKIANCNRTIGGFCESDWLSVSDREKEAVSRSAAAQRAARTGYNTNVSSGPSGQNNVFFGGEQCFIFSMDGSSSPAIYNSRPSMNANFMYLFDTHPQEEKIGIGMGGQPGYFGWFIDRWLETGYCHGTRCTTFGNLRLSDTESWTVEAVEAYAVSKDAVSNLTTWSSTQNTKTSVLNKDKAETTANQFMLETYGLHKFDQNERPNV